MAKTKNLEALSLKELSDSAKELATKANEAFDAGKFKEAFEAGNELGAVVDQYAATKKEEVYCALKKTSHPMLEAVKQLTYETIVVKESVPEGKVYKEKTIETRERAIDLIALDKYCGGGIGANPEWISAVKFLAAIVAIRYAKGYDDKDVIKELKQTKAFTGLSAELKEKILNGKTAESVLEKCATDVLNEIIRTMLGDGYETDNKAYAKFVLDNGAKKGREKLTVNVVSNRIFAGLLAEVAHGIIFKIAPKVTHKIK